MHYRHSWKFLQAGLLLWDLTLQAIAGLEYKVLWATDDAYFSLKRLSFGVYKDHMEVHTSCCMYICAQLPLA
jgi:hypothetical protein